MHGGGLPAQRNHLDLGSCLTEVYLTEPGLAHGHIPDDPELPLPLDKVHPLHEVVKVDYFIPGCPPHPLTILDGLLRLRAEMKKYLEK